MVKLQHVGTGADLHSHEVAYGSGSGQQSVTALADPEDANSFWAVRAPQVSRPQEAQRAWRSALQAKLWVSARPQACRQQADVPARQHASAIFGDPQARQHLRVCAVLINCQAETVIREQCAQARVFAQGEECAQGTPLKSGARLRLQHINTRTWLHSHHFPSPLTQNQEARRAPFSGLRGSALRFRFRA